MKLRIGFTLLFVLILSVFAQEAHAQFWKKWFPKEEKRRPRPVVAPKKNQETKTKPKKKKNIEYPASKIKSRYRIDVLAPLYLDDLVKDNKLTFKDKIPEKAVAGISFYEGIKLAADTLSALGYHVDVFIHDITQKDFTPEALLKANVLEESDLIIGALQSNQLSAIAEFAKKSKINFISAFSPSDAEIKDNPFFTMLQPTLETHCERLRALALKEYPDHEVLLFYRTNNSVDSLAYSYIISDNEKRFEKISWNKWLQKKQIERFVDSSKINLVIMPIVDNNDAEKILQQLHDWFPEYAFEVYGMPSWKFIGSLKKPGAYPNVAVHFTSPFYYDVSTKIGLVVTNNYRKQFAGRPAEMVFRGYETLYWYAYLLQKYGTVFNTRQSDNSTAAFTKFEIKPQWNKQQDLLYNENEHMYFYRYQAGSYMVTQ